MKIGLSTPLVMLVVAVVVVPCQAFNEDREVAREKRTIQYLVNHFAQFFGLSNPPKPNNKQDNAVNPLQQILMASSGKFSGGSGSKKATSGTDFTPFEIPSQPQRLVQEAPQPPQPLQTPQPPQSPQPPQPSLPPQPQPPMQMQMQMMVTTGPSRIPLLDSIMSTVPPTMMAATEAPSTTTGAPVTPSTQPPTDAPEMSTPTAPPTEEAPTAPDETTVDPAAVNTLANNDTENRIDTIPQNEGSSVLTQPNSFFNVQQYRAPAWNTFPNVYRQLPLPTYFGNNVFLPAPFAPQPFSHIGYQHPQASDNLITAGSSTSHSRVKMHDQPFDFVTYHGDSTGSPPNYQVQVFGKHFSQY